MLVIPAIDLQGGKCVRLRQGRAEDATVYSSDPVAMAQHWVRQGAAWLHVVDLDGAFQGRPAHLDVIARIAAAIPIPVEVGGGLRSAEAVQQVLDCGVARAIVGTRALQAPATLAEWVARFGARLAVGIDARDGFVQVQGWVETTTTRALDLAGRMEALGVATLIYTDTATDGMLQGPNLAAMDALCRAVRCAVIASGGVTHPADVAALARLGHPHLAGCIVGKALYEGAATLPELTAAARAPAPAGTP